MLGRRLEVPASFASEPFTQLYRTSTNAREKVRFLALSLLQEGKRSSKEIASIVRVSCVSISKWVKRYRDHGVEGLREQPGRERKKLVSPQEDLPSLVNRLEQGRLGGRVMAKHVQEELKRQGTPCSLAAVYLWLRQAGLSWVTSRNRHPQSNPEAQQEFTKKIQPSGARSGGGQGWRQKGARVVPGRSPGRAAGNDDAGVGAERDSPAPPEATRI